MREKSHKGQKHKGCGLCDTDKRAGNGQERRPIRDRRQLERARDYLPPTRSDSKLTTTQDHRTLVTGDRSAGRTGQSPHRRVAGTTAASFRDGTA